MFLHFNFNCKDIIQADALEDIKTLTVYFSSAAKFDVKLTMLNFDGSYHGLIDLSAILKRLLSLSHFELFLDEKTRFYKPHHLNIDFIGSLINLKSLRILFETPWAP